MSQARQAAKKELPWSDDLDEIILEAALQAAISMALLNTMIIAGDYTIRLVLCQAARSARSRRAMIE